MKVKIFTCVMLLTLLFVVPSYAQETTPAEQTLDEIPITVLESGTKVQVADMEAAERDYHEKIQQWLTELETEPNVLLKESKKKEIAGYPEHFWDICLPKEYILTGTSKYQGMVTIKDEATGNGGWFTLKSQPHHIDEKTRAASTEKLFTEVLKLKFITNLSAYNESGYPSLAEFKMWEYEIFDEFIHRQDVTTVLFQGYKYSSLYSRSNTDILFEMDKALSFLMVADQVANGEYTKEELASLAAIYKNAEEARAKLPYLWAADACFFRPSPLGVLSLSAGTTWTNRTLLTPSGLSVAAKENRSPELSDTVIKNTNSHAADNYHSAVYVSTATCKYNCHSYAWYRRSTNNIWWIENPINFVKDKQVTIVSDTLEDSPGMDRIRVGDVAYWINGGHSAEVIYGTGSKIRVRSKWGERGLYDHDWNDCEYSGAVWVYRMPLSWTF